jgi:hypothetical protein
MDDIRNKKVVGVPSYHVHIVALSLLTGWEKSSDMNIRTKEADDERPRRNGGYSTGWTYKWVDEFKKNGELRNMYKKIAYELGHAGIYKTG